MATIMEEIWKQIVWRKIETDYAISNLGNIVSLKFGRLKKMKPYKDRLGYYHVDIRVGNPMVHQLVAAAFIPNPNNLPEVNHLYGRKWDNRITELEWASHGDNIRHAVKNGLITYKYGKDNPISRKIGKFKDGGLLKIYDCTKDVLVEGFSQGNVVMCAQGIRQSHKGFQWKYM